MMMEMFYICPASNTWEPIFLIDFNWNVSIHMQLVATLFLNSAKISVAL